MEGERREKWEMEEERERREGRIRRKWKIFER